MTVDSQTDAVVEYEPCNTVPSEWWVENGPELQVVSVLATDAQGHASVLCWDEKLTCSRARKQEPAKLILTLGRPQATSSPTSRSQPPSQPAQLRCRGITAHPGPAASGFPKP
jgi:hypothetical protein